MASIKAWTMTPKSMTEEGNKMKEIFSHAMQKEGHITEEQREQMNKYCLVVAEKTFFGKFWDTILWKKEPEAVNIIVVKVLG